MYDPGIIELFSVFQFTDYQTEVCVKAKGLARVQPSETTNATSKVFCKK